MGARRRPENESSYRVLGMPKEADERIKALHSRLPADQDIPTMGINNGTATAAYERLARTVLRLSGRLAGSSSLWIYAAGMLALFCITFASAGLTKAAKTLLTAFLRFCRSINRVRVRPELSDVMPLFCQGNTNMIRYPSKFALVNILNADP